MLCTLTPLHLEGLGPFAEFREVAGGIRQCLEVDTNTHLC